ncbi:hypothetical protein ACQ858_07020 [Variovorax ureilyticus]|uniref:hypothetical protein n=1 Tax=Variovorax ureilyticus TaxID=1836198 RepID=UPI003D671D26
MTKRMKKVVAILLALALTACSAPSPRSADEAGAVAAKLFKGPQPTYLIWVHSGSPSIGLAMASAMIGNIGLDSPKVAEIHKAISQAADKPLHIAVSGPNSRFTAKATLAALSRVDGDLPGLSLAFVGDQADAVELRTAVEAKGAAFLFAPANSAASINVQK